MGVKKSISCGFFTDDINQVVKKTLIYTSFTEFLLLKNVGFYLLFQYLLDSHVIFLLYFINIMY